jgi:hypothetical protein
MSIKQRLIALLVRVYPSDWRREYGAEFADLLSAQPLDVAAAGDVLWNGLRQRLRSLELSTIFGLGAMLAVVTIFAWNIVAPQPYGRGWTTVLEPSHMTFPTISIRPLKSDYYALFLILCGFAIHVRYGTKPARTGVAAMKISLMAGLPIIVAGVLMLLGVMHATVVGPNEIPSTFRDHGFAFTYYNPRLDLPAPISVLLAPVARLGESWIWGTLGGRFGVFYRTRIGRVRLRKG